LRFFDKADPWELAAIARRFIAAINARDINAICSLFITTRDSVDDARGECPT